MKTKKVVVLFLSLMSLISCKEDKEDAVAPTESNTQEVVTYPATAEEAAIFLHNDASKTWNAKSFNLSSIGIQDCRLDDQITFNSDGTYSYLNGNLKCGADVSERNGTYSLRFENKQLIFDEGTSSEEIADLQGLSQEGIVVTGTWSIFQISATFGAD